MLNEWPKSSPQLSIACRFEEVLAETDDADGDIFNQPLAFWQRQLPQMTYYVFRIDACGSPVVLMLPDFRIKRSDVRQYAVGLTAMRTFKARVSPRFFQFCQHFAAGRSTNQKRDGGD